ncbi:MAG: MATE family efflux transporter, partial [Clostridia bacterium]|nr:MATE family efflux transporter [Clostridia bacterium]
GSVIITALLMQKKRLIHLEDPLSIKPDGQMIKRILRIGIPSGIENSMFQIGKLLVAGMVSTFGTAAIAANAIANNFTSLQVMPGASVGTAMLTVIGRYMGAGDHEGAKKNAIKLMKLAYLVQWGMIALLLILHKPIMGLYAVTEESVALASKMYVFHAIGSILIWPHSFNMPNVLRAAGDVKYTMTVSMVFVFLARVVSSYLLAFTFNMGVMGIWVGMQIDWVFRSIFFTGRYISGKWLTKKVIE